MKIKLTPKTNRPKSGTGILRRKQNTGKTPGNKYA